MIMNIAEPLPEIVSSNHEYDLVTRYLIPGVQYDHATLKSAYYAACNAGMWCKEGDEHFREGTVFRDAIYQLWVLGDIEMTEAVSRYGEKTDFFGAVTAAHAADHPDFKLVPGYLEVLI